MVDNKSIKEKNIDEQAIIFSIFRAIILHNIFT